MSFGIANGSSVVLGCTQAGRLLGPTRAAPVTQGSFRARTTRLQPCELGGSRCGCGHIELSKTIPRIKALSKVVERNVRSAINKCAGTA